MIHVEASNAIIHLQDSFDNSALLVLWRAGLRCDIVEFYRHTHSPQVFIAVTRFPLLGRHSSCHCISAEPFRKKQTTQENTIKPSGQSKKCHTAKVSMNYSDVSRLGLMHWDWTDKG